MSSKPIKPDQIVDFMSNTTKAYVDANAGGGSTVVDADATTKGILKLTNQLGGTADAPTVPELANKEDKINKAINLTNPNDINYPTTKAVSDAIAGIVIPPTNDTTKEDISNKATDLLLPDNVKYPTTKAVSDALAASVPTLKTIEGQSLIGVGNIDLTQSDVGLSNVNNTADLSKPISTATQTALNLKSDALISTTTVAGTTYTILATDNDKRIITTNAAAITITVPTGLPVGFNCSVKWEGVGQPSFVGAGTTLRYSTFEVPSIVERYGIVAISYDGSVVNEIDIFGKLTSI